MSSAATPLRDLARKAIDWSIALSVLLILAGLFALFMPFISGIGITLFFGWAMILSGITHFIFAFKTHTTGGVIWEILLGVVYLFTGVYLILHPLAGLSRPHPLPRLLPLLRRPSSSSSSASRFVPATAPAGSSSTASSPSSSPS